LTATWFGESREFIRIGNDYVTLWKQYNNKSYIIWGKYYGITSPSNGYIKTTNTDNIVLYVTQSLPNVVIYKHDEDSVDVRNKAGAVSFEKYDSDSSKFHSILYKPNMHTMKDLTEGSHSLTILVKEKYIIDEKGERQ
jgi:hypothetical protein